jgi:hypothetical protein
MERTPSNLFKINIDSAFGKLPTVNSDIMSDANKFKKDFKENSIKGGLADNMSLSDIAKKHKVNLGSITKEFKTGVEIEMEHTDNKSIAREIAKDHLYEDPKYYSKLSKIETKEATTTGSSGSFISPINFESEFFEKSNSEVKKTETKEATTTSSTGSYETPAAWAKSTNKKHWRGKSKPQIPGGEFVSVKKKCKKFPYCNQGDIKALNLFKNESLDTAIKNVSKKMGISEDTIKMILENEFKKINKRTKQ